MATLPHVTSLYCHWDRVLLLVADTCALLMLLTACVQPLPPVTFDSLCGLGVDQLGALDEAGTTEWVKDRFSASPLRNQVQYEGDDVVVYAWPNGVAFLINGRLAAVTVNEADSGISFERVVSSLGLPEGVSTELWSTSEATNSFLWLWYPTQGLLLGSGGPVQAETTEVRLTRDSQVTVVNCFEPGSLESLQRLGLYNSGTVVPWPGFGAAIPLHNP